MKLLLRLSRSIDIFNERVGRASAWLTLAAVVVCTINAVVRYTFHMSSNGWLEIQWYLNAGTFLLIAAYTLKRNEHIRIDAFYGRFSPRTQAWVDIVGGIVALIPVSLIIIWYSLPTLANSWQINEYSSDAGGLIRWPVRLLIPVAFSLLVLQGLSEIIKRVAFLKGLIPNPGRRAGREAM